MKLGYPPRPPSRSRPRSRRLYSILLFLALVAAPFLYTGCGEKPEAKDESSGEKKSEPPSRVKHETNGTVVVTVDQATQKLMGLQTTELRAAQLSPELKAYGRVLDVTPLVSLVADLTTARTAAEASHGVVYRLMTLAAANNASERALQAAQAAAAHDQAQTESIRLRLLAGWGPVIAARNDLAGFVQSLASLHSVLVELELPAGQAAAGEPSGALILVAGQETNAVEARFVSTAPVVDPQMQGRGFLFFVDPNAAGLTPNGAVSGFIRLPGAPKSGVGIPPTAVVRYNGADWIYLQTGDEAFQRTLVALEHPLPEGWFASAGLKPGDKVVTTGAQQLLSEELKTQGGEE